MGALTAAKKKTQIDGADVLRKVPVAANAIIYANAMVGKLGGYAVAAAPGSDKVIGVAALAKYDDQNMTGQATVIGAKTGNVVDNTGGADGARHIAVQRGCFKFLNKAGDPVDETMIGDDCYVENDQTVRKTGAASIVAGTVVGIEDDGGVYVMVPSGAYGRV